MSEYSQMILLFGVYRIAVLAVGALLVYLGYRLFVLGVYEKAGDLKASWGEKHLVLKQAAPGTFFALFGAAVISIAVWKGIHIRGGSPDPTEQKRAVSLVAFEGDCSRP